MNKAAFAQLVGTKRNESPGEIELGPPFGSTRGRKHCPGLFLQLLLVQLVTVKSEKVEAGAVPGCLVSRLPYKGRALLLTILLLEEKADLIAAFAGSSIVDRIRSGLPEGWGDTSLHE